MEENNEELSQRVEKLEKQISEIYKTLAIMKSTHSFDMGRVFEEIDKINGEIE